MIAERTVDGFPALSLAGGRGEIEATFVPGAGMVGCSLRDRGEELLGQRGGLRTYVEKHSTMGIPLLHPWANRLGRMRFPVAGREVVLDPETLPLSTEENGLPIHGLLAGAAGWEVERRQESPDGGAIAARFDFAAHDELIAAFPFPHEVELEAALAADRLTIATTVTATGEAAVPISFGFHPYFRLPNLGRSAWEIETPLTERFVLDDRGLPSGDREPADVESGPLGERTFDDAYLAPPGSQPFVLSGGGRRIEVSFDVGFRFAQLYAPAADDVIAFEPMTAPTNALVTGGAELPLLEPGESYRAAFSIGVFSASAA